MSKRSLGIVSLALIVAASTTFVQAESNQAIKEAAEAAARAAGTFKEWKIGDSRVNQVSPKVTAAPRGGMATIQYDDGTMTSTPAVGSNCFGNRFDTLSGNPVATAGNVTGAQFYMATVSGTAAFVSWFDQLNTGAGTANGINSVNKTGLAPGWNTVTTSIAYAGNSVLAGVWYGGGDVGALGTGTNAGQGHHGFLINDIVATGYSALTTVNTLFRISGNPLPVELMTFSVD